MSIDSTGKSKLKTYVPFFVRFYFKIKYSGLSGNQDFIRIDCTTHLGMTFSVFFAERDFT